MNANALTVDTFAHRMIARSGGIFDAVPGVGQVAAFQAAAEQEGLKAKVVTIESYSVPEFQLRIAHFDTVLVDIPTAEGISEYEMVKAMKDAGVIPFIRRDAERTLGLTVM